MSLYFVYNMPQLKVGYMSTTNIERIISRYKTYCGSNISVYMFIASDPRLAEAQFKSHFKEQHVELEFYDSTHFLEYVRWATEYTNSVPIVGDGKVKKRTSNVLSDCPAMKRVVPLEQHSVLKEWWCETNQMLYFSSPEFAFRDDAPDEIVDAPDEGLKAPRQPYNRGLLCGNCARSVKLCKGLSPEDIRFIEEACDPFKENL
jgi:hypothetical protein